MIAGATVVAPISIGLLSMVSWLARSLAAVKIRHGALVLALVLSVPTLNIAAGAAGGCIAAGGVYAIQRVAERADDAPGTRTLRSEWTDSTGMHTREVRVHSAARAGTTLLLQSLLFLSATLLFFGASVVVLLIGQLPVKRIVHRSLAGENLADQAEQMIEAGCWAWGFVGWLGATFGLVSRFA